MTILFPIEPYSNYVDESYLDEYNAAISNGFDIALFDFDLFQKNKF